jgi:transposase
LKTFAAILYFHHAEVLQKHIAEMLDVSEHTIVDYSNFIREQCSKVLLNRDEKLGGFGVRVQVGALLM